MTMNFPALTEARGKLDQARKSLRDVFTEAGPDLDMTKVKSVEGDSAAVVEWVRTKNEEIDALAKDVEGLEQVARAAEGVKAAESESEAKARGGEPGDGRPADGRGVEAKSLGDLFTESVAFKGKRGAVGPEAHLDIDIKALMTTAAGWTPETTRTGRLVDFVTPPIQVIDLIPGNTTTQSAVVYMEETTYVNAAAEVAEGGAYPESELGLTEKSSPVRKIATFLPVTDEQLEDVPQARGYINNRLPFMLRQRLDSQIVNGNGTAPNLRGFLNTAGIQTQAQGTGVMADAFFKAMVDVQVNALAQPNAIVMNPLDWSTIRLMRTADGIYIWGNPADAGPQRMWGLPVAMAVALAQGTGLVLDTSFTELDTRRGIDVQVSNSHADYFVHGQQAVRADTRVALVVYRPAAICEVTGLAAPAAG
jgi:HK97 family phage major capsid protein